MSRIFWEFSLRALSDFNQANNLNILMKKTEGKCRMQGNFLKIEMQTFKLENWHLKIGNFDNQTYWDYFKFLVRRCLTHRKKHRFLIWKRAVLNVRTDV